MPVFAKTKVYAMVIGNNAPPADSKLATLRYADDDAVRFYRFFKNLSDDVFLMTVPDGRTQERYPGVVPVAQIPTVRNFDRLVEVIRKRMTADRTAGDVSVFYLVFSGHGAYGEEGKPFLAMSGGGLTQERLYNALRRLDADFTHLFVDACYAEGVVGSRGMFDDESDSRLVSLSEDAVQQATGDSAARRLPGLGVVMASTEYQKTHEWSQIESGIFTHEILSGLVGPADINSDGKIEYSELVAFISAANREVTDNRAKINVIAKAPKRNQSFPLVDFKLIKETSFLTGDLSPLGRFHIELANGERYLDANLADMHHVNIIIPNDEQAYLLSGDREAVLKAGPDGVVEVAMLTFDRQQYTNKGSIESALNKGLFSTQYGLSYYKGFIDSTGFKSVRFNVTPLSVTKSSTKADMTGNQRRKAWAMTSFAFAGVSATAAVVFGAMALRARNEFQATTIEKKSTEANEDYTRYSSFFWPTVAMVPIAVFAGVLLIPKKNDVENDKKNTSLQYGMKGLSFQLRF